MKEAVPRPRLPHLVKETTRHGKTVWYVRIGQGPRTRLSAKFGTKEFEAEYHAAIKGNASEAPIKAAGGSIAKAVRDYRQSSAWLSLSVATRRQRENIFKKILESAGRDEIGRLTRSDIVKGRERRAATPAAGRHFIETMRGLCRWAVEVELIKSDPTEGLKVGRNVGDGFAPWTDEDLERFRARWVIGTRQRVALDLLYYTGLRRGDAVMFGRQHVKNGVGRMTTEKTGERVTIPIELEFEETISGGPCGELSFIAGAGGRQMTKESFGNWFRGACRAAGVEKSAHGLRKAGATRDAERGWSESELEAKYGWRGGRMASHYTRSMNRERLAIAAAERTKNRTSIPAPVKKVRDSRE